MSVTDPVTCGFVKVFCYELFTSTKKIQRTAYGNRKHNQCEILKAQYESFTETFLGGSHGIVKYHQFTSNFKNIVKNLKSLGKQIPKRKKILLETFSTENWDKLGKEQEKHTICECHACVNIITWKNALSMFPGRVFKEKQRAKIFGLCEATALKGRTKEIFNKLNKEFRNHYTRFAEQTKEYLKIQKPSSIVRLPRKISTISFKKLALKCKILYQRQTQGTMKNLSMRTEESDPFHETLLHLRCLTACCIRLCVLCNAFYVFCSLNIWHIKLHCRKSYICLNIFSTF